MSCILSMDTMKKTKSTPTLIEKYLIAKMRGFEVQLKCKAFNNTKNSILKFVNSTAFPKNLDINLSQKSFCIETQTF